MMRNSRHSHAPPAVPFVDHPAFQSLVLPLLLAGACGALLRAIGPRWAALGAALGLVLALAFWPGFHWPAGTLAQKLPWAVLAAFAAAALATASKAPGSGAMGRKPGLIATALLTLAALALAAWAAHAGSLLLAQIAVMLASVTAVAGLWSWWWRSMAVTPAALAPLLLAWLAIAGVLLALAPPASDGTRASDDPYYTPKWD